MQSSQAATLAWPKKYTEVVESASHPGSFSCLVQVRKRVVEVVGLPASLPGMVHVLIDAVEAAGHIGR